MGRSLNAMVANLSDLARTNRAATSDLNAAAAEIRASAQEQAASVEEQFAAVQEIETFIADWEAQQRQKAPQ